MKKKRSKKFHGKSMRPGGGGRFAKMVAGIEKSGKSADRAKAIAAAAGRKKYGKAQMSKWSRAGRKRAQKKGITSKVGQALS